MHRGGTRTTAWLLSSAAFVCLVPAIAAEPFFQPNGLSVPDPNPRHDMVWKAIQDHDGGPCGGAFEEQDRSGTLHLDFCRQMETSRGVKFGYSGLKSEIGIIDLRGGMAQLATTGAMTVDRMVLNTASQFVQKNTALTIGLTDRLFGDRFTIGTDLAWSQNSVSLRTLNSEQFGNGFGDSSTGSARWHRAELKIFDAPEFRWSATGDYSLVDDSYSANQDGRPRSAMMLPGERWSASTSLKAFDVGLVASAERYDGRFGARESDRVSVALDGLAVVLNSKRTVFRSSLNPSLLQGRSEATSATVEFVPIDSIPEFVAENESLSAFVPDLTSITWSQGYSESAVDPKVRRPQSSVETMMSWSGTLGDTMAIYWRESKDPAAASQGGSASYLLDVSHTIRWGAWRVGVGGMLIDYSSESQRGFEDATLSGSFLLAYEVTGGPNFNFRVGHDSDQFSMVDESFASKRSASDLTVSLDLSAYVRKHIGRPDTRLTFEFRKKLDHTVETSPLAEWNFEESVVQNNREGLLISFGMRL